MNVIFLYVHHLKLSSAKKVGAKVAVVFRALQRKKFYCIFRLIWQKFRFLFHDFLLRKYFKTSFPNIKKYSVVPRININNPALWHNIILSTTLLENAQMCELTTHINMLILVYATFTNQSASQRILPSKRMTL